ncbi:MAG: type VI secretion system baseplate subunit TssK [Bryobacterales bacterium]|nr:type VI secretion system baseplate subunit TssK [Bryobacterales bacterium]
MKYLSKVVWNEGMHLSPHHFQAQARFYEDAVHFALSSLFFAPYGLAGIEMDAEALRNGTLGMIHARGVLPDGLAFHMPECDPLPEARPLAGLFSPARESHLALLAIEPYRSNRANTVLPDAAAANGLRYAAEKVLLADETTGRDEKPVFVNRKQFRLLLDVEAAEGLVALPVARIKRDGRGHFVFDPDFIPPCLQIAASERIMQIMHRLIELLEAKSETLTRPSEVGGRSLGEFASRDVANFWFLHAIYASLGPLRNLFQARRCHPETLYAELARLAGALCTFAVASHPRTLPLYNHDRPEECFDALDRHIREHLEIIIPTNVVRIPLTRAAEYFHNGEVTDPRCLGHASWVLAVRSPIGEANVIQRVPQLAKFCAAKYTPELVRRALPGLTLTHQPHPPSAISVQPDVQYFSVTRTGPCWEAIVQTKQVSVYVPGEIPEADVELLVVLDLGGV